VFTRDLKEENTKVSQSTKGTPRRIVSNRMGLNTLHLTVGNRVVNNLNGTLIVIVKCSRGLYKKYKFTQKLANPYCLCTYMNDAMIFDLCSQQRDYLMFLAQPNQRSSAEAKHIARSGLPIIIIAYPLEAGEADQRI
jgi:hypothetical protein